MARCGPVPEVFFHVSLDGHVKHAVNVKCQLLCFYVVAVFRPHLISFYTLIIFSFILFYLVLPCAISSESVHPFM